MNNRKIKTAIDIVLELVTIALIWGTIMLLLGMFTGCAKLRTGDGPAKQQNFLTPGQTSGKGSEIPVNQIDLNQDGMIDATEQTIITSTQPDVLLTFGVITGSVFLLTLLCAWMANRTSRKDAINRVTEDMMDDDDMYDSQPPNRLGR